MSTQLETEVLDTAMIDKELQALRGWGRDESALRKTFECGSFLEAIALVNRVAAVAEELDHHPDIAIDYKEVTFRCWTHKAKAITRADLNLAREIEKIAG